MMPTLTIDTTEFRKAAQALLETDKRSTADFVNGQLLKLSIEAVRQTQFANSAKIEADLGVVANKIRYSMRGKNIGKLRLTKVYGSNTLAHKILGKRMAKTGSFGFKGVTEIETAVRKLIASRKRSANFIRAGWIWARNKMFYIVKEKPSETRVISGAKTYGKPKGFGYPAIPTNKGVVEGFIENKSLMEFMGKYPAKGGNPMPIAQKGLQAAMAVVSKDMMQKLAERLARDLKPYQAK